ncbi:MAG: hypothetical protein SNJ50_08400 [Cyanobacteriota bacterium]
MHECCFEGVNGGAVPPRHHSRKKSIYRWRLEAAPTEAGPAYAGFGSG